MKLSEIAWPVYKLGDAKPQEEDGIVFIIRDNKLEVGFKGEDLCFLENTLFGAKMGDVVDIPIGQLMIKYKQ